MENTNSDEWDGLDQEGFFDRVEAEFYQKAPDFSKTLNIVLIGKVSSGKSSLINALLKKSRRQALETARVGAIAGVQKDIKILKLDDKVCLIDSPGLDDVRNENSDITKKFLKNIDIGIFVVTGAADASQRKNLNDLKEHCDSYFVVLNKIDVWDDLKSTALEGVIKQWKDALGVEKIYPTCTKGYDPDSQVPYMDIRGVSDLRRDIEKFLEKKGKDLLLARHMAQKQSYAIGIIATALLAVAGQAFVPGSSIYITATQGAGIASLHYLYTGQALSPKASLSILPTFIAQSTGSNLFLFAKSFLPPTGLIDIAAAGIAVSVTLALLATVNSLLSSGSKLSEEELLRSKFKSYRKKTQSTLDEITSSDNFNNIDWKELVRKVLL